LRHKRGQKKNKLKVLKYSDYQDIENNRKTSEEQVKDKRRTSKEQEKNINNNDNNLINIKEDEEERCCPEIGKVPTHCQDDDPVLAFIDQVSSYYTTLTGRLTSPNDEVAITDIAKHTTNADLVKEAMARTAENYKPVIRAIKSEGLDILYQASWSG